MTNDDFETSFAANKRLIQNHSDKRVSEDAVERLQEYIERKVVPELVRGADGAAEHAGRNTIQEKDVKHSNRIFEK